LFIICIAVISFKFAKIKAKMKRTILVTVFFLLCNHFINAQQSVLTWGELSNAELSFNSFVKGSGSDMIKLCFDTKKGGLFSQPLVTPIFVRYDSKLQEKKTEVFKADEKDLNFDKVLSIKGKLYMFTHKYDKGSKATAYQCTPIDIITLKATGSAIDLGTFDAISKSRQSTVQYKLSADSSKLIMFGLSPFSKKDNEKYYMGVYDDNMNKLWDKTVELPYKDKFVTILDNLVTNDGRVGVILKHYDQEVSSESIKENGERIPAYKTKLLLYEKEVATPYEYIIDINNKFVHSLHLTDDKATTMNLFGLYKEKYNGHVNGFFTASINLITHKIETSNTLEFPLELVELVNKDRQGSDKEKDPGFEAAFGYVQTIYRSDGSKDYLLEFRQQLLHEYRDTRGYSYSYWEFRNGDIIDISVKTDGRYVICRIPKMQDLNNTRNYNGFKALTYNDKLVVYYNDNEDNVNRELTKKPETMGNADKCVFMMATVDATGHLNRNIVFNHKEVKLTVATNECFLLDEQHLGIYAIKTGGVFFTSAKDMVGMLELK